MKLTVLIDLDDTLLSNNMDTFLKAYLHALGKALSNHVSPEVMVPRLLSATREMTRKTSPAGTLEDVFNHNFYPPLGLDKATLSEEISRFYNEEFPKIQSVTSLRPQAVELMDRILSRDWDVVIATNPLFPHTAVMQRVQWAGLEGYLPRIHAITSFDRCHFAKPNPAYYAEILGQLGWPDQPAVMIGNSLFDDILPAALIGLPAFFLDESGEPLPPSLDGKVKSGSLEEVFPWLESIAVGGQAPDTRALQGLLAVLASTPAALDSLCSRIEEDRWKKKPAENEWSPAEILCHLRDVDREVNLPRFELILREQNPFLPAVETDPWAVERSYQNQDGRAALTDFLAARIRIVDMLSTLPEDSWNLPARHAIFGPTTLRELAAIIISHDKAHLNQMVCALII